VYVEGIRHRESAAVGGQHPRVDGNRLRSRFEGRPL
jgi:hypothetical protein